LEIVGGLISRGRWRAASETFVWTSCSAESMFRPMPNSSVRFAPPCRAVDDICRTPSTVEQASSRTSTTSVSMISGEAPSQEIETLTIGKSTSGFWLTPRPRKTSPKPV
jgi:hypothetical protein